MRGQVCPGQVVAHAVGPEPVVEDLEQPGAAQSPSISRVKASQVADNVVYSPRWNTLIAAAAPGSSHTTMPSPAGIDRVTGIATSTAPSS